MRKLWRLMVIDEPWLYAMGALAAAFYGLIGVYEGAASGTVAYAEATTLLFRLYLTFAIPVGAYMLFCNLIVLIAAEPKTSNCEEYETYSSVLWRLLLIISIFASFPASAYLLKEFAFGQLPWWAAFLISFLLAYGFTMHHHYNRQNLPENESLAESHPLST